jgi:iron complex transport system substrate-binding protein
MYRRIISLAPSNTEILFSLGAGRNVVGVTTLCDFPEGAKSIHKIGSWMRNDVRKIDQLKPDIILASMFVPREAEAWAEENNVRLVNIYPQTVDDIYESIIRIGELVGNVNEAGKIIHSMKFELDRISKERPARKLKIYSEEFHKPPMVAANWVPQLIEAAGGIAMSQPGKLSYEVSAEDVLRFNPDIIVLHWCGYKDKSRKDDLLKRKGWNTIPAVAHGRIVCIDDTFLNRPGPRLWMGAEILQKQIAQAG